MNKKTSKSIKTAIAFCAIIMITMASFAKGPTGSTNHDYESTKMKLAVQIPDSWESKVKIEENDNSIVFKYINPGGEPVFLLSFNKISETQWLNIHDQLQNVKMLSHKDGNILYAERTDKTKIKGANSQEFAGIVSRIDEVIKSFKEN